MEGILCIHSDGVDGYEGEGEPWGMSYGGRKRVLYIYDEDTRTLTGSTVVVRVFMRRALHAAAHSTALPSQVDKSCQSRIARTAQSGGEASHWN